MAKDESPFGINFGARMGTETSARELDPETPFHIAVLGDFSGRAGIGISNSVEQPKRFRAQVVDRDNFEEVMQQLDVRLDRLLLANSEQPISLKFQELDDFEPDVLFDKLEVFADLRSLRARLLNPNSFDDAAKEVVGWKSSDNIEPSTEDHSSQGSSDRSESPIVKASATTRQRKEAPNTNSLLDQVLSEPQQDFQVDVAGIEIDLQRLVSEIAAPFSLPATDPRQQDLIGCVDAAIQAIMLVILQHPRYKQLESNWRALRQLVFDLETDSLLKIYLIDVSKSELADDVLSEDDLTHSQAYRLFVEQTVMTPGAVPWAMLAGAFYFNSSPRDVETLGRLAKIASASRAPFVAGAIASMADGSASTTNPNSDEWRPVFSDYWKSLRELPDASYLGLVWPRFLLRLPYGASTKPIERFEFEEVNGIADKSRLLWGNPAFLFAKLLGQSFIMSGWDFDLGDVSEVENLPVWIYQDDGQSLAHPCGEWLLKERVIACVSELGVMPLISVKDRPTVRIGAFRSVRGSSLQGRWN